MPFRLRWRWQRNRGRQSERTKTTTETSIATGFTDRLGDAPSSECQQYKQPLNFSPLLFHKNSLELAAMALMCRQEWRRLEREEEEEEEEEERLGFDDLGSA